MRKQQLRTLLHLLVVVLDLLEGDSSLQQLPHALASPLHRVSNIRVPLVQVRALLLRPESLVADSSLQQPVAVQVCLQIRPVQTTVL